MQLNLNYKGLNKVKNVFRLSFLDLALFFVGVCAVFIIALLLSFLYQKSKFIRLDETYKIYAVNNQKIISVSLNSPTTVRSKENPVNGIMITDEKFNEITSRKLVVISVNNHSKARPQFGLSRADLVLEVLAEGGITRYNAFYYLNQDVKKIGPVRSARTYMLYFLLGFDDPIFVHEGQAMYPKGEKEVPEINTLKQIYMWKVKSMQTAGSRYRDKERIRKAGYVHSLMTGFDLINKEIDRLHWRKASNITPLKFKFDDMFSNRGKDGQIINIQFTSLATKEYSSSFTYDKKTNTYLRSVGGKEDIDALNGTRIAPKNVIIEFHNYRDAHDGHSRIIIDMLGEDKALVFRDGKVIEGKWKKENRTDRTRYYDNNGDEIVLNRGQIWVVNVIKTKTKEISKITIN